MRPNSMLEECQSVCYFNECRTLKEGENAQDPGLTVNSSALNAIEGETCSCWRRKCFDYGGSSCYRGAQGATKFTRARGVRCWS